MEPPSPAPPTETWSAELEALFMDRGTDELLLDLGGLPFAAPADGATPLPSRGLRCLDTSHLPGCSLCVPRRRAVASAPPH